MGVFHIFLIVKMVPNYAKFVISRKTFTSRSNFICHSHELVHPFDFITSYILSINPLSANPTKWSNTLKQFVGKLPTNCLSKSDHFVGLTYKGLNCCEFGNRFGQKSRYAYLVPKTLSILV